MIVEWLVGTVAGFVSGCGVGGGTLLLLYLTAVVGMEQRVAAGVNLLYFIVCSPVALFLHFRQRTVNFWQVLPAALGGAVTAALAAWGTVYLPTDWLRRGFGVMLIYIGIKCLFPRKEIKPSSPAFRR